MMKRSTTIGSFLRRACMNAGSLVCFAAAFCAIALSMPFAHAQGPYIVQWGTQVGTTERDIGEGCAIDQSGNVYVCGSTEGVIGSANAGTVDAFVSKYSDTGAHLWTKQFGTPPSDTAIGIAVDAAENVYVTGTTYGSLGGANAGEFDAFVLKFDSSGNQVWSTQVGTPGEDVGFDVAVDVSGNIYLTGYTGGNIGGPLVGQADAFVIKFGPSGSQLWARQISGGIGDYATPTGIAADAAGNVCIAGRTRRSLAGPNAGQDDAFVVKYDTSGTLLWSRQLGTAVFDRAFDVAFDSSGNVYICGETYGTLGGPLTGFLDAFIAKFDALGTQLWIVQFGSVSATSSVSIAIDAAGDIYTTGRVAGDFGGPNAGLLDVYLAKLAPTGTLTWAAQIGTPEYDEPRGIAIDSSGSVYIAGKTEGNLAGPYVGGSNDAFVLKYVEDATCYADCDESGALNILDYICFGDAYAIQDVYADCDTSGSFNILDYICFGDAFAAGCP